MRAPWTFAAAAASLLAAASSAAQTDYPSRPIRLVVTSAAGGSGDTVARAISKPVEKELHVTIVVDNRPGASGIIGTDAVVKAEPNGYTLLQTSSSLVTGAATGRKLPYDVGRDLTPVSNIAAAEGYLVLVHPGLGVASIKELVALAKTRTLLYGSPGVGNPIHFTTESLNQRAGTTMRHVPYKGLAPAMVALISGEIQVLVAPPIATKAHIAAGRMRALASVSAHRIAALPEVPTMEEVGFPGFTLEGGWQGWFAPARTPATVLGRLHGAIRKAVADEDFRAFAQNGGYVPGGSSPAEFREQVMADLKRFRELARIAHIKAD